MTKPLAWYAFTPPSSGTYQSRILFPYATHPQHTRARRRTQVKHPHSFTPPYLDSGPRPSPTPACSSSSRAARTVRTLQFYLLCDGIVDTPTAFACIGAVFERERERNIANAHPSLYQPPPRSRPPDGAMPELRQHVRARLQALVRFSSLLFPSFSFPFLPFPSLPQIHIQGTQANPAPPGNGSPSASSLSSPSASSPTRRSAATSATSTRTSSTARTCSSRWATANSRRAMLWGRRDKARPRVRRRTSERPER